MKLSLENLGVFAVKVTCLSFMVQFSSMKLNLLHKLWIPLLLFCLVFPALEPLLRDDVWPCTHDNSLHYHRIAAMREGLRLGWGFSRWVPHLALGYGYPFFNFREPLPYIFGTFLYALGIPLPIALELIYMLSFLAAAWGAWTLARDLFGPRAAWVAALAYGLGPYLLLDALRRGNMPESVALALLPWLLVVFRRLIYKGGWPSFVACVLLLIALFLSHNISSLLFAPFLGGYVVLLAWVYRERKLWPWAFAAVALAVGMTAWFWLPALAEQDTVQLHLSRTTRNNDFHYNFAHWREILFTLPPKSDPDFLNAPMHISLGSVRWSLALVGLGLAMWRMRDRERRVLLVFFAGIALLYVWMSTPASVWLWEAVPVLAFVQFPWRLVGRALLPVALLAGAAFARASHASKSRAFLWDVPAFTPYPFPILRTISPFARLGPQVLLLLALAGLALFAYPYSYPPKGYCAVAPYPDLEDVYTYELRGRIGVDPEGSYFPVWVEKLPRDTRLMEAFIRGEQAQRFDFTSLPTDAHVLDAHYKPLRASLHIQSPVAFQARWLGFYYPGWQVTVDGVPVVPLPEADTGMLTFPVPMGVHHVTLRFGHTPLRSAATWVSGISALLFMALIAWGRSYLSATQPPLVQKLGPGMWEIRSLSWVALLLLLLKLLIVDRLPNPIRGPRLGVEALPDVTKPVHQPFEDGLTLLGYTLGSTILPADAELRIDLLWGARAIPSQEYHVAVLLVGPDEQTWSPAGTLRPRGYEPPPPTTLWLPGDYAYDPHIVQPLPGTPPGTYRVVVSLFDKTTQEPASVVDANGNPLGPVFTLGSVHLLRPQQVPDLATLGVPEDAELWRCETLGVLSMRADREQAAPGDPVAIRWLWASTLPEGLLAPQTPVTATLALRDAAGHIWHTWSLPPSAAWWPTNLWAGGERWLGQPLLRLPSDLEGGTYYFEVRVPACTQPLAEVELEVTAPHRVWEVPEGLRPMDVTFGGKIRLVGYALDPLVPTPGDTLHLQLAWQALGEMSVSYRVFVHLIGPEQHIFAQSDGEPVAWTRPTTGWAPGEVVTEMRELSIPPDVPEGLYHVWLGWYVLNGPRLELQKGGDTLLLETFALP